MGKGHEENFWDDRNDLFIRIVVTLKYIYQNSIITHLQSMHFTVCKSYFDKKKIILTSPTFLIQFNIY